MESNVKLKEISTITCTCYYFDNITKLKILMLITF